MAVTVESAVRTVDAVLTEEASFVRLLLLFNKAVLSHPVLRTSRTGAECPASSTFVAASPLC
jgi:hypothetical protein